MSEPRRSGLDAAHESVASGVRNLVEFFNRRAVGCLLNAINFPATRDDPAAVDNSGDGLRLFLTTTSAARVPPPLANSVHNALEG